MFLEKGSRGSHVKNLQFGLRIMCINPGGINGVFGYDTEKAVMKFQQNFGLPVDGIVRDNTWDTLKSEIRSIQCALQNHGYSIAGDGIAGPSTYSAVMNFQRSHGLIGDGMVGSNTKNYLF